VPQWVIFEGNVLREARERLGLSREALARELHVVAKTWERYERDGRVPRQLLPRVADILDLEIELPTRERVQAEEDRPMSGLTGINARLDSIEIEIRALDRKLDLLDLPGVRAAVEEAVRELRLASASS
jgi:transcriptional regulator with XRE-family HTH domain